MSKQNTITLNSGRELPLLNLKGKNYLQVAHRLVWFREDHPIAEIITEPLSIEATSAIFRAKIVIGGTVIAVAHKKETESGFPDFVEKAETGAVGRALAFCGYGTQFEPALDEGDRLADSPIDVPKVTAQKKEVSKKPANAELLLTSISNAAKVIIEKKKMTLEEIKALLNSDYNVGTKEELDPGQQQEFLDKLIGILKS